MFGRRIRHKREKSTQFILDIDQVVAYFKAGNYIETPYKAIANGDGSDKLSKEIRRALDHVEWIKGFEYLDQFYMIYHGQSTQQMKVLFNKYRELSISVTGKDGYHKQANDEIENYVVRDDKNTTLYMLRVGNDLVKACVSWEEEEQMKQVFSTLNSFVYKREK
ncbi:MAG: hypothetical protein Q4F05_19160 [bacterium]|nr:hypothetical protein [bacterium]